jgi:ribose transport system substrate-binding protein
MKKIFVAMFLILAVRGFAQPYRIALITDDNTNVFWKYVYTGAAKARDDLKAEGIVVNLTWDGPVNDTDATLERKILEQKIADKVNGIVLSPANVRTLVEPVSAAAEAGIATVVINAGLGAAGQISFVSTDNYKGGSLAARKLGLLLKGKGNVILFRWLAGNAASGGRETGFLDTIRGQFPGIKVISADQYANGNYASARKTATDLVQSMGRSADGIFTPTEITTETMLLALREAGLNGKQAFVGFDSNEKLIDGLRAGDIKGLVIQNPMQMGYVGVRTLVDHFEGKPVEKEIDTGCRVVTVDNLDAPEIQAILHPPVDKYLKQ